MRAKTLSQLWRRGQLRLLMRATRLATPYYRGAWLAAACRAGVLRRLADGAAPLERLAQEIAPGAGEGLRSWLDMGVRLRELECRDGEYALRGFLARKLAKPDNDSIAAMLEEVATLHHRLLLETPDLLRRGRQFTLDDQDGVLIARSSRVIEPFVQEAIDDSLPSHGPVRLLEVGAGSGTYIRYAAARNPELTARGLELQPQVADLANGNLREWGLAERAHVDKGDVRDRTPEAAFDLVTLHNNIYYFPVEERPALLRHLRGFLTPGGRLLLTTGCAAGSPAMQALDIWSANTRGCGRLPEVGELEAQLREAGFADVHSRRLMPGESYYAFEGRVAGGALSPAASARSSKELLSSAASSATSGSRS
jgi:SAM-dependent methyltransferase